MRPNNATVVTAQPTNATINLTNSNGHVIWSNGIVRASFQAAVSAGTVNGALKVQASNDKPTGAMPENFIPTNWNDISGATVTIATAATSYMIPYQELCYEYLRLVYTDASGGTATSTITVQMKSIAF